jgi:hypothetical protein
MSLFHNTSLRQILNVVTTALSATKENRKSEQSECLEMRSGHCTYYMFTKIQMARQIIIKFHGMFRHLAVQWLVE